MREVSQPSWVRYTASHGWFGCCLCCVVFCGLSPGRNLPLPSFRLLSPDRCHRSFRLSNGACLWVYSNAALCFLPHVTVFCSSSPQQARLRKDSVLIVRDLTKLCQVSAWKTSGFETLPVLACPVRLIILEVTDCFLRGPVQNQGRTM